MIYNPSNWYWIVAGNDSQVFSSTRSSYVPTTDETYEGWLAAGNYPTRIDAEASLIEVLATAAPGVTVPSPAGLTAYTAAARYAKETGGITVGGSHIATDRQSQALINGAFNMTVVNPSFTTQWKSDSSPPTFVTLNAPAIAALATAVGAHVAACFAVEATVVGEINASPPTITTTAEVDAAFAAIIT